MRSFTTSLGLAVALVMTLCVFTPFSSVKAAAGQVQVMIRDEARAPIVDALIEVSCDGTTFATLGTTDDAGSVVGDPTVGTTCVNGSGLQFRVSSSTIATQLYPIIGYTLLPYYASVDYAVPASAISGSTNIFKFGVDASSTYAMSVWNAAGDASVLPFPTSMPDVTFTSTTLAFNWGNDTSPYPGINPDDWFVEATKTVTFSAGWYEFEIASDDGNLVTLDGATVISNYVLQAMPGRPYIKRLLVSGGSHTVDIKYYEHTGFGGLYFRFYPIDTPSAPILEIGAPISSPTNDRIGPSLGFHTDTAGILSLSGGCTTTDPVSMGVGTSTIYLGTMPDGTYDSCRASITDPDTGLTTTIDVPSFTVAPPITVHISTCEELEAIDTTSTYYAVDFALDNDIDCLGVGTHPISWSTPFLGTFDGGGYSITNFSMNDSSSYVGLFARLRGATIKNLTMASGSITGRRAVGAIAGDAMNTSLQNISSSVDITATTGGPSSGVAGIVGNLTLANASTTVWSNVRSVSTVLGRGLEGGLIGQLNIYSSSTFNLDNAHTTITVDGRSGATFSNAGGLIATINMNGASAFNLTNSSADGTVRLRSGSIGGGLIGSLTTDSYGAVSVTIDHTSTSGSLTGRNNIGGLIGYIQAIEDGHASTIRVTHSQSATNVTGSSGTNVGGFVGQIAYTLDDAVSSIITFDGDTATGNVTGNNHVGGFIGGTDGGIHVQHTQGAGGLTIYNSTASGDVTGGGSGAGAGGFIGYLSCASDNPNQLAACVLRQNRATGNVTGNQYVGGFAGQIYGDNDLEDVYSTGNVTGALEVGGLIGNVTSAFSFTNVSRAYASSTVTTSGGSPSNVGGLIGSVESANENTHLTDMFNVTNLVDPSGAASTLGWMIGNLSGVTPINLGYSTTSATVAPCVGNADSAGFCYAHSDPAFFTQATNSPMDIWDFSTVWQAQTGTYPTLSFNPFLGDVSGSVAQSVSIVPSNATALISWYTSERGSSNVLYGTDESYAHNTGVSDRVAQVVRHNVSMSSLTPCTLYHFQLASLDVHGNGSTSTDATFQTSGCAGGTVSGGSGGGGGGGGSYNPIVSLRPTFPSVPSTPVNPVPLFVNPLPAPSSASTAGSTTNAACVAYPFSKNVKMGVSSDEVKQLQRFLNQHGALIATSGIGSAGQETGYFGKSTKQALQSFQRAHQLPANGVFTDATRSSIQRLMLMPPCTYVPAPKRILKMGMRGDDVLALQHLLKVNETGYFGLVTKKAVQQYQASHHLLVTGEM